MYSTMGDSISGFFGMCCYTLISMIEKNIWARSGHARTTNHRGRCSPDRISRPHMGRECVGPPLQFVWNNLLETLLPIFYPRWCVWTVFIRLDRPVGEPSLSGLSYHWKAFSPAINEEEGTVSLMEFPVTTRFTHMPCLRSWEYVAGYYVGVTATCQAAPRSHINS
jgi:hypothetical protein